MRVGQTAEFQIYTGSLSYFQGAFYGLLSSQLVGLALIIFKLYSYAAPGRNLTYYNSVESCETLFPIHSSSLNKTLVVIAQQQGSYLDFSFWYIPAICFIIGLVFAFLMSILSSKLICPVL